MKLLRVGPSGAERPAALDAAGNVRDLSAAVDDIGADVLSPQRLEALRRVDLSALPIVDMTATRVGPPVRPAKVVCVGLNYRDHAAESGMPIPAEPILFLKASHTVAGPDDDVTIPRGSLHTDWEVELGVIVGTAVSYLESDAEARAAIAGYCVVHDVSERRLQLECGGQWDKGKNCATFCPLGPYLVTADEVPEPHNLALRLSVNGVVRQNSNTGQMIFSVEHIVRYVTQFMPLFPGDVIATGTPAGVAHGLPDPKPYLRDGDLVELTIAGLGSQRQRFVGS